MTFCPNGCCLHISTTTPGASAILTQPLFMRARWHQPHSRGADGHPYPLHLLKRQIPDDLLILAQAKAEFTKKQLYDNDIYKEETVLLQVIVNGHVNYENVNLNIVVCEHSLVVIEVFATKLPIASSTPHPIRETTVNPTVSLSSLESSHLLSGLVSRVEVKRQQQDTNKESESIRVGSTDTKSLRTALFLLKRVLWTFVQQTASTKLWMFEREKTRIKRNEKVKRWFCIFGRS